MKQQPAVAATGLLLILPAALFMAAVFMQGSFDHPHRAVLMPP